MFHWFKEKAIKENKLMLRQNVEASHFLLEEFRAAQVRRDATEALQLEMERIYMEGLRQARDWDQLTPLEQTPLELAWTTNRRLREVYGWFDDSKIWQFDDRFGGA